MKERQDFFEKIMGILDGVEGKRDTAYGPFSFLWERSYVRDAVVSSFDTTTSITGLKIYLAMNVLEMHASENASRISYEQLRALLQENSAKKYNINYLVLDECMDVEKNKEAVLDKLYVGELAETAQRSIAYIKRTDEWFPYLFMEKLRSAVWSKLREFFKLCEQSVCSECSKKSKIYFQFIQALALYENFYIRLLLDPVADYIEKELAFMEELSVEVSKFHEQISNFKRDETEQSVEEILEFQKTFSEVNNRLDDKYFENHYRMEVYQMMLIEFGISLNAMCYLLMIFEAIQAHDPKMRGIKHLSLEIKKKLSDIYDRELAILAKSNRKRESRYRAVNKHIEELLEQQYPKDKEYDAADALYTFMEELSKPVRQQNKSLLRGLEVILGAPVYHEQIGKNS